MNIQADITAKLTSKIDILENWTLSSKTNIEFTSIKLDMGGGQLDVSALSQNVADALKQMSEDIDKKLQQQVDVRLQAQKAWTTINQVHKLGGSTFLRVNAFGVGMFPIKTSDSKLILPLR